ncbi:hypothetical protein [Rhizobium sp. CC-YZS058]|uniref:hypothetical protein n=1 Tax=Rhizobium sp. CC-YZS058 TaxID=3042153 RepID=UPI002B05C830|nr:hypothetical protein [Rhizobium sp. CC-YZS058]MEA3536981.1 hypothetical protein [Rhizobium sp. CC-YZS058]
MHFARQAYRHIQLRRAGLGFLSLPPILPPRTHDAAGPTGRIGRAEGSDCGISWNPGRSED